MRELPWTDALRDAFGFETPASYRALEARGMFRFGEEVRGDAFDLTKPGDRYLWLNDMEWMSPEAIRQAPDLFEEWGVVIPVVPFATTGGGDFWCWHPRLSDRGSVPILLCRHDCNDADDFAPDFSSALYRQAVEFVTDREVDAGPMLRRRAVDLAPLWPPGWPDHLERLAEQPIDYESYRAWVARQFGNKYSRLFGVPWKS